MSKIVSVEEMQAIERAADQSGLTYDDMMANAGESVAGAVMSRIPSVDGKRVVILAGSGNNGGDGLVAGYHLLEAGAEIAVYLAKEREMGPHQQRLKDRDVLVAEADQDQRFRVLANSLSVADIVIDAVFGTGLKLPLRGDIQKAFSKAQAVLAKREDKPFVVAVDCPSGLDADTGEIASEALKADLTVTLAAAKKGLLRFPGANYTGELIVGDIGLDETMPELEQVDLDLADQDYVRNMFPDRPRDSHKGTFGTVYVIGGSINLPGAAVLAGMGAYRIGAGLV
ncbi:MAG: NAD(P)H-hydrate epimerase, partial [Anaerolineales bacterium]